MNMEYILYTIKHSYCDKHKNYCSKPQSMRISGILRWKGSQIQWWQTNFQHLKWNHRENALKIHYPKKSCTKVQAQQVKAGVKIKKGTEWEKSPVEGMLRIWEKKRWFREQLVEKDDRI